MAVEPGLQASVEITVSPADTAAEVGSGDVPVLATPRLLALAEAATVGAIATELPPEQTSVGIRVELEHLRATPIGSAVRVRVELVAVEERQLRFQVTATDGAGQVVGRGTVTRAVVDRDRFLARA
jgi:fluoroacetyl-CoA thioesterase